MSEEKTGNVRVIDEYERVLSNPSNVIISDELQSLIDMPMEESSPESLVESETLGLTLLDGDGLSVGVRGELHSFSCNGSSYSVSIDCHKVRQEVLSLLELKVRQHSDSPIIFSGLYNIEVSDWELELWSVERVAPHTLRLTARFGSENVIF
tara:strand:- start:343 stop:798 length:456 start_codon:yes stop_codon:yes gene_type:complete